MKAFLTHLPSAGRLLRAFRTGRGLHLQSIAYVAGIETYDLTRFELDEGDLPPTDLVRILDVCQQLCGCVPLDFLERYEEQRPFFPVERALLERDVAELTYHLRSPRRQGR